MDNRRRILLLGDASVGKTTLLRTYAPQIEYGDDGSTGLLTVRMRLGDGARSDVEIWDMPDDEDDWTSHILESETHAILLCASAVSFTSFQNLLTRWLPLIERCAPNVPIVLVATKLDLARSAFDSSLVVNEERRQFYAEKVQACAYAECRSDDERSVREAIELGVRWATKDVVVPSDEPKPRKRRCLIS